MEKFVVFFFLIVEMKDVAQRLPGVGKMESHEKLKTKRRRLLWRGFGKERQINFRVKRDLTD